MSFCIDPHIHMISRVTDDYQRMALSGCVRSHSRENIHQVDVADALRSRQHVLAQNHGLDYWQKHRRTRLTIFLAEVISCASLRTLFCKVREGRQGEPVDDN